jgi:hypothetical protein
MTGQRQMLLVLPKTSEKETQLKRLKYANSCITNHYMVAGQVEINNPT